MKKNHYDALIFDLDGTLWNSCPTVAKAWNEALQVLNLPLQVSVEQVESICGMTYPEIFPHLFPHLPTELLQKMEILCMEKEKQWIRAIGGDFYEEMQNTLKKLAETYRLFIVSNCQSGYIESFLAHANLGKFIQDIECHGNTNLSKSHNIQLIIQRNQLKNPLYIGDTQKDLQACEIVGIDFLYANYGFGKLSYEPAVSAIRALPDLLG